MGDELRMAVGSCVEKGDGCEVEGERALHGICKVGGVKVSGCWWEI